MPRFALTVHALVLVLVACGGAGDAGTGPNGGSPGGNGNPSGSVGVVLTDSFPSAALGVTKHYVVYLPPSYASQPTHRFPVIYLLHGSPGTENYWVQTLGADSVLDSLARAGLPQAIVVFPDGDSWWYHDWVSTPPACLPGYTGAAPLEPCVSGLHYRYDEYIAADLVAHIDATYRTQADMQHRAIGGNSMGGYGAALLALEHPDEFNVAALFSGSRVELMAVQGSTPGTYVAATSIAQLQTAHGSEWPSWVAEYGTDFAYWQAHDPSSMVAASASVGRRIPPMWMIVGNNDLLHSIDEYFNSALNRVGATHVFSEVAGDHSNGFWRAHEGDGLAWLLQHIGS